MSDNISTAEILAQVGKAMPNRQRISGSAMQSIKLVPTGEIVVNSVVDSFQEQAIVSDRDNLQGKEVVLVFGKSSHFLTQNFLIPKMALIYHHLTVKEDSKVEFLYVSLPDETKQGHERAVKSIRKCKMARVHLLIR